MAQNKKTPRSTFYEVVFRGKPKVVRAFLEGLIMGSDTDATIIYSYLEGIHHEGKAERMAEMVGIRSADVHVIVDRGTSDLLKKLKRRIVKNLGLEITSHRHVRSASMSFEFQTYAPRYHQQIVGLLDKLPTGLRLDGYKVDVERNPDAKGIEAYAPVHDFCSEGSGSVVGAIDQLVAFKVRCLEFPLIKTEDVMLTVS